MRHSGQLSPAIGHNPASGSRGNDELRTPCAIRALLLGRRLSVAVDNIGVGQGRTGRTEADPGDGEDCSRSEKAQKYLIMRERIFSTRE